jgi:hypothetical protein
MGIIKKLGTLDRRGFTLGFWLCSCKSFFLLQNLKKKSLKQGSLGHECDLHNAKRHVVKFHKIS